MPAIVWLVGTVAFSLYALVSSALDPPNNPDHAATGFLFCAFVSFGGWGLVAAVWWLAQSPIRHVLRVSAAGIEHDVVVSTSAEYTERIRRALDAAAIRAPMA